MEDLNERRKTHRHSMISYSLSYKQQQQYLKLQQSKLQRSLVRALNGHVLNLFIFIHAEITRKFLFACHATEHDLLICYIPSTQVRNKSHHWYASIYNSVQYTKSVSVMTGSYPLLQLSSDTLDLIYKSMEKNRIARKNLQKILTSP